MNERLSTTAARLAGLGVSHPRWTLFLALTVVSALSIPASRLTTEVGYAAYFGPEHARVERLQDFVEEFGSGFHVLVVFGCGTTDLCERVTDRPALELIASLQADLDQIPNVRRTESLLTAPVLVAPLETRSLGRRTVEGRYALADGWQQLAPRALREPFLRGAVVSSDGRNAGIVVELQSVSSEGMRSAVHGIQDLLPSYEDILGTEIYLAGDPVWTVISSDDLSADSTTLTVLMFVAITAVLYAAFRSFWLTLTPVLSVAALTVAIRGLIAIFGIPMTSILAALPPLLVVIMITSSMHLLAAYLRSASGATGRAVRTAAAEVGAGCFWASMTTAGGFASFVWSDLTSFRHFGIVAAAGLGLSYLITFTLLPALLCLADTSHLRARRRPPRVTSDVLSALFEGVTRRPVLILATNLCLFLLLSTGIFRVYYEADFGFGERHFVYRSLRFIEENFRKPMTTEIVIQLPEEARVYDRVTLELLERVEAHFSQESSTGAVWSFLDFLEEAYRVDKGQPPVSSEALRIGALDQMPLVSSREAVFAFWTEGMSSNGQRASHDRLRVSVDRAWLDDAKQGPYVERIRALVAELRELYGPRGYRFELHGGLFLADLFVDMIRETQWKSFASAFAVVTIVLILLTWRQPGLTAWAVLANLLPASALLGTMGWAGIGIDPANSMVAAILIAIAVDDTIHVALRYQAERRTGSSPRSATRNVLLSVGHPVLVTSACLALGFSVLMFSRWGGLASFGLLAGLGVFYALVCDLLLLPAGLLAASRLAHREQT